MVLTRGKNHGIGDGGARHDDGQDENAGNDDVEGNSANLSSKVTEEVTENSTDSPEMETSEKPRRTQSSSPIIKSDVRWMSQMFTLSFPALVQRKKILFSAITGTQASFSNAIEERQVYC